MGNSDKVYSALTQQIVDALEEGEAAPWQMPWNPLVGMPRNVWGRYYRGFNRMLLGFIQADRGYESPVWITWNQVHERGGRILGRDFDGKPSDEYADEDDEATNYIRVVLWKWITKTDEDGNEETFPLIRYYKVYNLDQTAGLEEHDVAPAEPMEVPEWDDVLETMPNPPEVKYGGNRATYSASDVVTLPARHSFDSPEMLFKVGAHELVHSTGHPDRLDRFSENADQWIFASESYSDEELVAEIGAAMLCAMYGIEGTFNNSVDYIAHWKQKLEDDTRIIIYAASRAQKAVDWILDQRYEDDEGEA